MSVAVALIASIPVSARDNTIRAVARKGYGSIAHEAQPNGLLIRAL